MARVLLAHPLTWVLSSFVASRVAYYQAGVRFNSADLGTAWQLLDPSWLRDDLLRSLTYLHSQPPAFNLFVGIMLKLFPGSLDAACWTVYLGLGCVMATTMLVLQLRLGVPRWLSALSTILFIASPAAILYESWLFYTYPLAALLCVSAWLFNHYLASRTYTSGLLLFGALALIALTASMFHMAWLLLIVLGLLAARRDLWRRTLACAALPLLLVAALYLKNLYLFGSLTASTWFGMNLTAITTTVLHDEDKISLVRWGEHSPIILQQTFQPLETYQGFYRPNPPTGVPALDRPTKAGGEPNFNHSAYIEVSRAYQVEAVKRVVAHPAVYAKGMTWAYFTYFLPANDYPFLNANRRHIVGLERWYDRIVYGRLRHNRQPLDKAYQPAQYLPANALNLGLSLVVMYGAAGLYGLLLCARLLRRRVALTQRSLTLLFLWLNVAYVTLVGNAVELGENNRFRFMVDPLCLMIVACMLSRALQLARRAWPALHASARASARARLGRADAPGES